MRLLTPFLCLFLAPLGAEDPRLIIESSGHQALIRSVIFTADGKYLVSAGDDAHWTDPLANMRLTVDGYVALMERLRDLAAELCGGRLVAVLEGGYNLDAVAGAVVASCQVLAGQTPIGEPLGPPPPEAEPPAADQVLAAAREVHRLS